MMEIHKWKLKNLPNLKLFLFYNVNKLETQLSAWKLSFPNKSQPVAEFKEFGRWFKFKPRLKYGWFHLKLYQMFPDLSQR